MFGREWDLMTLERTSLVMSDAADGLFRVPDTYFLSRMNMNVKFIELRRISGF